MTSIPPEIGDTIIATIIYFAATSVLIEKGVNAVKAKLSGMKNKEQENVPAEGGR